MNINKRKKESQVKFKINGGVIIYHPQLAKEIGEKESMLLSHLIYKISKHDNERDGKDWYYASDRTLQEYFSNWCLRTIKNVKKSLIDQDLIIIGNYNKKNYDKTTWYSINYDKVAGLQCMEITEEEYVYEDVLGRGMTYEQAQRMHD